MTRAHRRILTTLLLAALPPALWMLRNVALIGHTSAMQRTGETFMVEKLLTPFTHYGATLGLGVVIAALVIGYAIRLSSRHVVFLMLVVMGHFAAVYLPSLVTQMNALDHRLMFPVTVMLALTVAVAMNGIASGKRSPNRPRRRVQMMVAAGILFTVPTIVGLDFAIGSVYQPPERALWERLHTVHRDATYFESGNSLVHQVYADMPQVVVWEDATDWVRLR